MKDTKEPNPDGSGRIFTVDKVETAARAGENSTTTALQRRCPFVDYATQE